MVSTLDFESGDPSSNLGGTLSCEDHFLYYTTVKIHVKWTFFMYSGKLKIYELVFL